MTLNFLWICGLTMNYLVVCVMAHLLCVQSQVSQNKVHTKSACIESMAPSLELKLTCEKERIRVISKICANETMQSGCPDSSTSCVISQTNDDDGLDVKCNGRNNCVEGARSSSFCTVRACEFVYECIEGSMDMCSPMKSKSLNGSVYLHTSGFPASNGSCSRCSCRVYGTKVTVTVVEHRAEEGVVTISTDKTVVWASNSTHYNKVIASGTSEVVVNYETKGPNGSAWINIAGNGSLLVSCEKGLAKHVSPNIWNSSTPGATTETTSHQSTTDNGTTEKDTSLSPVATAFLGALCGFLLGIVFAVCVAVLFRRRGKLHERVVLLCTRFKERGSSHNNSVSYKKQKNHCAPTLNVNVEHPIDTPTTPDIAAVEGQRAVLEPPVTDVYTKVLPRSLRLANTSNKNNQVTEINQSGVSSQLLTPQMNRESMFNNYSSNERNEEVKKNFSSESQSSERNEGCGTNNAKCMSSYAEVSCEVLKSSPGLTSSAEGSNWSCVDTMINDLYCGSSSTPADHLGTTNAAVISETDMNSYKFVDGDLDPKRDEVSEGNLSDDQSQSGTNVSTYDEVCGDAQQKGKRESDDGDQTSRLSRGYAVGVQTSLDSPDTDGSFCSGGTSSKDEGAHAVKGDAELDTSTHSEDNVLNGLSCSYSPAADHRTSSTTANTSQTDQNLYDFIDGASDHLGTGDVSNNDVCAQVGSDGDYAAIDDAELRLSCHSERPHSQPGYSIYEDIAVVEKLN